VKDEDAARQEPSPTSGHLTLRQAIWSPRTCKVGPERTLRDPRERFFHGRVKHPSFETRCWCGRPRDGFRGIFRALWRRGREVFSPASRRDVPPHASAWARDAGACGDFFGAVGVGEGAKRSEICSPATCEVLFGARRRARARRRPCRPAPRSTLPRRRAMNLQATAPSLTPTRAEHLAGLQIGQRRGGMQAHSPASWRCVPRHGPARTKARWPAAPST